jgi:hypothetical protein
MLDYVFKKADLIKMIDESLEDEVEVLVRLKFSPGKDGTFPARVTARCQKAYDMAEISDREISGCPRPPGCD